MLNLRKPQETSATISGYIEAITEVSPPQSSKVGYREGTWPCSLPQLLELAFVFVLFMKGASIDTLFLIFIYFSSFPLSMKNG